VSYFLLFFSFMSFFNPTFRPAAELQLQDAPDHSLRPKTSISSSACELSTLSSYPSTLNVTSSIADATTGAGNTQHTHTFWFFFERPVVLAGQVLLPRVQDQVGGMPLVINRGVARVEVGHTNVVEIEIPTSERNDLLRDVPQWR
jgi:hypothetical protein